MGKLQKNRKYHHKELVRRSILFFALLATLCTALIIFFNNSYGTLPALGKFLSPHLGIWQNGLEAYKWRAVENRFLSYPLQSHRVSIDKNGVLHIMAERATDAYFLQGYMQARDRLWQMDFNVHIAEGRIAEIIGIKGLAHDKWMRKMDLKGLAKKMEDLIMKDTAMLHICQAYTDGVNAYVQQLHYAQYPVEYKIFSTKPEAWSIYKTALICKLFTYDWSSYERDIFRTQFIKIFGEGGYRIAFPNATSLDIPPFNAMISGMPSAIKTLPRPLNSQQSLFLEPNTLISPNPTYYDDVVRVQPKIQKQYPNYPDGGYSFVLAPQKTTYHKAFLATDIQQSLSLPNYWYELQMAYPTDIGYVNTYGVTYPGLPGIIIGFNSDIAWSINVSKIDNKDFLYISFTNPSRTQYRYNKQVKKVRKQEEVYKIRGHKSVRDTLFFTDMGVLFWDEENTKNLERTEGYVMRWKSSIAANDLKGFILLNRAQHYLDYQSALLHIRALNLYVSYADKQGNTGMNMQGELPLRWREQGRFLSPGEPSYTWNKIIDRLDLPYVLNSPFGFSFVASGLPFYQGDFPYYLSGEFESYHAKRLHDQLRNITSIDRDRIMRIMGDTYNTLAAEFLPLLLPILDLLPSAGKESNDIKSILKKWNYLYTTNSEAATIFTLLLQNLQHAIWNDELKLMNLYQKEYPPLEGTLFLLQNATFFSKFIDNRKTSSVETLHDILLVAWEKTLLQVSKLKKKKKLAWAEYALTQRPHVSALRSLRGKKIVNTSTELLKMIQGQPKAMGSTWKMVVELSDPIQAYGYMAGGQSGNPCSPRYNNESSQWRALHFLKNIQDSLANTEHLQTFYFHLPPTP